MNIYSLDFNLIKNLEALITYHNITKAAIKVGITQPAMSNALMRIRTVLKDPILIKTHKGLRPTELALNILPAVENILNEMKWILNEPSHFNPKRNKKKFKIATSIYANYAVLSKIIIHLSKAFPLIELVIIPIAKDFSIHELSIGEIDLAIGSSFKKQISKGFHKQNLLTDEFICAVSKKHCSVKKNLTFKQFCNSKHIKINLSGEHTNMVDRTLEYKGYQRNITITLPDLPIALSAAANGEYILTEPKKILSAFKQNKNFNYFKTPFKTPSFDVFMLWSPKTHNIKSHQWLREFIFGLFTPTSIH